MRYIEWLPTLYEVTLRFESSGKGRSNIYLVLLDYQDREGAYGVYVGMSKYSPAQRFDQHKAGIRAAGSVLKRGLEVLTGPTLHLQYIKRSEASRIEEELGAGARVGGAAGQGGALVILIGMFDSPFVRRVAVSMNLLGMRVRTPQLVGGQGFRADPAVQSPGPRAHAWCCPAARR